MGSAFRIVLLVLYLLVGLYLLNLAFGFTVMPETITKYENIVNILAGILLVLGGFKYFFSARKERVVV